MSLLFASQTGWPKGLMSGAANEDRLSASTISTHRLVHTTVRPLTTLCFVLLDSTPPITTFFHSFTNAGSYPASLHRDFTHLTSTSILSVPKQVLVSLLQFTIPFLFHDTLLHSTHLTTVTPYPIIMSAPGRKISFVEPDKSEIRAYRLQKLYGASGIIDDETASKDSGVGLTLTTTNSNNNGNGYGYGYGNINPNDIGPGPVLGAPAPPRRPRSPYPGRFPMPDMDSDTDTTPSNRGSDAEDESLQRYKESLGLGGGKDLSDPNDPRVCIIQSLTMESPGRDPVVIDLTAPGALENLKKQPFKIKEGVTFTMSAKFKVQHEILSGLHYVQVIKRKGIRIPGGKTDEMIVSWLTSKKRFFLEQWLTGCSQGSYAPNTDKNPIYTKKCTLSPSFYLSRKVINPLTHILSSRRGDRPLRLGRPWQVRRQLQLRRR